MKNRGGQVEEADKGRVPCGGDTWLFRDPASYCRRVSERSLL